MKIKKSYIAPTTTTHTFPAGRLCQTVVVSDTKLTDPDDIGYSKKFWGGVEDDTEEFPWAQED